MRTMKDSGNQFIGLIPKHWIVIRLKHLLVEGSDGIKIGPYGSALKGKTQPQGPFKIYNQANVISGDFDLCRHFISAENYKALSSYTVKAGDVLFSMMGTIGKCRIMPDGQAPGIMDSHLLKARLDNKKLLPKLFCYIYDKDNNPSSFAQMLFETQGSIMNGLNSEIVKNLWLAYPPDLEEQQEITEYLDSKCSQIDEAIRRQESIIKKLREYRQSVITEAVTKGLDPNAEMKDSEIIWIGEIPNSWKIKKLKYIASVTTGDSDTQDSEPDGNYPFYVRSPIVEKSNHVSFSGEAILMAGDGVGAGKVFHFATGKYAVHQRVYRISDFQNEIYARFMYYYLCSLFPERVRVGTAKSTVDSIRLPMIKEFNVVIPSLYEQEMIVSYLDSKCSKIDEAISRQESIIEKLKTYRQSIIYEVVTGKREII